MGASLLAVAKYIYYALKAVGKCTSRHLFRYGGLDL